MTYNYFFALLRDAAEAASEEQFLGEVGFPAEINFDAESITKTIHIIYAAAYGDFKEIVKGYKLTNVAQSLGIPYRTLQNWVSGERTAPEYVTRLIAFAMVSNLGGGADGDI